MAEAEQPGSTAADASPTAGTDPAPRLLESALYKENVFIHGHSTVWGSYYDKETKRWGYQCCKNMEKNGECAVKVEKVKNPDDSSGLDDSTDSDANIGKDGLEIIDWKDPPPELLPREKFKKAVEWVEHFVRYYIGIWQKKAEEGYVGFGHMETQTLQPLLKTSMGALEVLIRRLHNPKELDRSEKEVRKGRGTRAGMEGKVQKEKSVLLQLDEITTASSNMDYLGARAGYMKLTLGNKTWNSTFVTHVAACTMKGAREYRRNRDNFNTYDMDPDSQKYMHALLKLVQLAQCIKPNPDQSKNNVF